MNYQGLLIHPEELDDTWVSLYLKSGLNLLGLHPVGGPDADVHLEKLLSLAKQTDFKARLDALASAGIAIEYGMHAMSWLLPRAVFGEKPEWFRQNGEGVRLPDVNGCPSNPEALAFLSRRAALLARLLPPTTGRYHFWLDDVKAGICHCEKCRSLTASDQQLIYVQAMLKGIKTADKNAKIAFLAYHDCMQAPSHSPAEGVFLEYAPIHRRLDRTIFDESCAENMQEHLPLKALLAHFGTNDSQVLDYWMDNSLLSNWTKPPKAYALNGDIVSADAKYYADAGFEHITSFGCYLGPDYRELYGDPPVKDFASLLPPLNSRENPL